MDEFMVELVKKLIVVRQRQPGVVVHMCNPSTQGASLAYIVRLCLEGKQKMLLQMGGSLEGHKQKEATLLPSNLYKNMLLPGVLKNCQKKWE